MPAKASRDADEAQAMLTPEQLRAALVKRWGPGAVRMASDPELRITRLPTGILSLDMVLGGGMARGRYTELYGSFAVGKTMVADYLMAETQMNDGRCAYYDAENSFDPAFAQSLGVDLDALEFQDQREHGNRLIDHMEALLRSGLYDVIVLDSIAALLPKSEQEADMEQASMGMEQAKMMSKALRKLTAANQKTVLLFINQTRQAVGASAFAKQSVTSGGKAMGFYAGTRIDLARTENIKESGHKVNMTSGELTKVENIVGGHRVLARIEKDKMQPVSEPVLTPTGWRPIGDLRVNELVIGSNGEPTTVTGVYPQQDRTVYRVDFTDGSWTRCGPDHLWTARTGEDEDWRVITTADMMERQDKRWRVPVMSGPASVFDWLSRPPVDPYLLGVLLGDGNLRENGVRFSTVDPEVLAEVEAAVPSDVTVKHDDRCNYRITGTAGGGNTLLAGLRKLGLLGTHSHDKFIPRQYMHLRAWDRFALLQGLMDSDGWNNGPSTGISSTSARLMDDVRELVESLGGTARRRQGRSWEVASGEQRTAEFCVVHLPVGMVPFRLTRKQTGMKQRTIEPRRLVRSIERVEDEDSVCIRVAAEDELYVTRHCIVTHNTGGALQNAETTFVYKYKKMEVDRLEDLLYLGRVTRLLHKKGTTWWVEGHEDDAVKSGRPGMKKFLARHTDVADELEQSIREWYAAGQMSDAEA